MGNNFCVNSKSKNKDFEQSRSRTSTSNGKSVGQQSKARDRRCTVADEEIVMTKIRLQMERIEDRIEALKKKELEVDQQLRQLMGEKKKEECFHCLVKKKNIRRLIKDNRTKVDFLDKQMMNIENSVNELGFVNAVKDSNRVIEKLNSEMDIEEIHLAKQLQEEGKVRREELMDLLEDEEDDELRRQLDDIEKAMIDQAMSKLSSGGSKTGSSLPTAERPRSDLQSDREALAQELGLQTS